MSGPVWKTSQVNLTGIYLITGRKFLWNGWHHGLKGHEFEQTPGDSGDQGAWRVRHDLVTERLQQQTWVSQQLLDDYSLPRRKKKKKESQLGFFPSNNWLFLNYSHNSSLLKYCQLIWLYYSRLNHEGKWNRINSKANVSILLFHTQGGYWVIASPHWCAY